MKNKKLLILLPMVSLLLAGCNLLPGGLTSKPKTDSNTGEVTDTDEVEPEEEEEEPEDEEGTDPADPIDPIDPIDPSPDNVYEKAEEYHAAGNATNLLAALRGITNASTVKTFDYDDLWGVYDIVYRRDAQGHIFDYYSSITNYTINSSHSGNAYEGAGFNREHSIPKSWWGGSKTKQGADPIIVVPTDCRINNFRDNYSFGFVENTINDKCSSGNFSKLGSAVTSWGYSGTVFEPNDSLKGDFARIYFYAVARYDKAYTWTQGDNSEACFTGRFDTNYGLTNYAVKLFSYWSKMDPVSDWERTINERLVSSEVKASRNPFIDHPEYADTLWGHNANYTKYSS